MIARPFLVVLLLLLLGSWAAGCAPGSIRRSAYCGASAQRHGFAEREVDVDGVKLHVHEMGSGSPPVLLVHGFGGTTFSWRHVMPALARNHRVVAFDLPGHGYSQKPRDYDYSAIHLGELTTKLIDAEGMSDVVIVGNSYGGAISVAAVLASQEQLGPDQRRIGRMILIDAAGYPQKTPWHVKLLQLPVLKMLPALLPPRLLMRFVIGGMYGERGKTEKAQIREYANAFSTKGTRRAYRQYARFMIPTDLDEYVRRYPDIRVPTLVITGDRDRVVPPAVAERFAADIPGAKLEVIAGAGHIPQEEIPAEVLADLGAFLHEELVLAGP